jgi:hypothetical protein
MRKSDDDLEYFLNLLGWQYRNNKEELKKAILMQKVHDKVCLSIIEGLQEKGQLPDLDCKELEATLDESMNIWLKEQLCDTLCGLKHSKHPDFKRVHSDIALIKEDLDDQRKISDQIKNGSDEVREEHELACLYMKKPIFKK